MKKGARSKTLVSAMVALVLFFAGCGPPVVEPVSTPSPSPTPRPVGKGVAFPDRNLEGVIRAALRKPWGEITTADLARLTALDLGGAIADLRGLEYCTNLTELKFYTTRISDISPLASLTNLKVLNLYSNQISDISPLVKNSGLGEGDEVWISLHNLDLSEGSEDMNNIKELQRRGVRLRY